MIEQYPYFKKENVKKEYVERPTEEEIEEAARGAAINWLVEDHIRKGVETKLIDPVVFWDEESLKIANDESEPDDVRERARKFLGSSK
jgi:hypothetical protein